MKNKQFYNKISQRNTNIWQLATNAGLANASNSQMKDRLIIKSFFRIPSLMVRKICADNHNFKDVVELVAECPGREIQTHLLTAPNATYLSPQYISSMIQVMSDYVKQPLHNILKTFNFSFYSDETTKITSTEQFVV